jgi:4-amino-4-deoxy-L-arabinose transferase-like glycosyltransferase
MNNRSSVSDLKPLFLFFLLSSVYLYPFLRVLWRIGDEGSIVYSAQLVAEGALPYRDFFEVAGPATYYWLGLFFKLFGTNFLVARALLLITAALTTILIYWMTRRLYRDRFDYLPALFYMLISYPNWPGSNHHWDSNLFSLLAIVTFLVWEGRRQKRYLIMAGTFSGITSCFMLQKGFLIFLAFILVLIFNRKWPYGRKAKIIDDLVILSTAYISVAVFVLLFFYTSGGLSDLIYATLIFPLKNYHKVNVLPYGYGLREWIWPTWQGFLNSFLPPIFSKAFGFFLLVPYFIVLALPFLVMALAASLYINVETRSRIFNSTTLICWSTGIALWVSELHRMDIIHLIYGCPILLIIFFAIWNIRCEKKRIIHQLGLILIVFPLIFFGTFNAFIALSANHQFNTRRGIVYSFNEDTALKFLHEQIRPGSTVFVYPYYPMYYFLANLRNPSRYNVLMYYYNSREQFKEAITALEQKKVGYVLWDLIYSGSNFKRWFPQYTHPPEKMLELENYLENHYRELEVRNGFRIMQRLED